MKNVILGSATGAVVGAVISMGIPCNNKSKKKFMKNKKRIVKKGKQIRTRFIKKIAEIIYKFM